MAPRVRKRTANPEAPVIEAGSLRFTRDRIEKVRGGQSVTAFARDGVRWVRVARVSASENPVRELLFGCGAAVLGYLSLRSATTSGKVSDWAIGVALASLGMVLIAHPLWRSTVLVIRAKDGMAHVALETKLSPAEIAQLNRRLAEELDWPVSQRAPPAL